MTPMESLFICFVNWKIYFTRQRAESHSLFNLHAKVPGDFSTKLERKILRQNIAFSVANIIVFAAVRNNWFQYIRKRGKAECHLHIRLVVRPQALLVARQVSVSNQTSARCSVISGMWSAAQA